MKGIELRDFQFSDSSKVVTLHEKSLLETGTLVPGPWDDDLRNVDEVYVRPGGCFVVIEVGNEIVAMGGLRIASKGEGELKRMRVHPEFQRQGLGQMIIDHLLSFAKSKGLQCVKLDTTEQQITAQLFYAKNGFLQCGRRSWNGFEVLLYEKQLV